MKFQLLLPLTIALTVALVVVIKSRKREHDKVDKRNKFESMKLRVTNDVVGEYQTEKISLENLIENAQKEEKMIQTDAGSCEQKVLKKKKEVDACQRAVKSLKKGVAGIEGQLQNLHGKMSKEKESWIAKLESLKKELQEPSAVCAFLKKGAHSASKLCDSQPEAKGEVPSTKQPNAEDSQAQKPKAENPKAQKPNAPKQRAKG
ncbi:neurofilament medium polypeptide [Hippocampus zosterae]|uniref:neurofilament medium polypeptide n=1 Tax=Hippocampus zosterae TaxID=109293 RepID=UPI00223DFDEA|nr:neurofilament medium polypeptide [Hippocampus zosterae]